MEFHPGIGYEKACRLSNTSHSEIAPSLSLPSLSVCFGAADQRLGLYEDPLGRAAAAPSGDRPEVLDNASVIAGLLRDCDVGYLNLKEEARVGPENSGQYSRLHREVLKYNPEAFECSRPGHLQERHLYNQASERKPFEGDQFNVGQVQGENCSSPSDLLDRNSVHEPPTSASSRKPKIKKKESISLSTGPDLPDNHDIIGNFGEMVEDLCGRAEIPDDFEGEEGPSLPLTDMKMLLNEIMSVRSKKVLQLIPLDSLSRLINVLDRQIKSGQGLTINENENENPDLDAIPMVLCALESVHAALAIMTHEDMPKQLYKEEIIERIIDFSRQQIMDCMAACNPLSRPHKPSENGTVDGDEEDDDDIGTASVGKRRRYIRSTNTRKPTGNKISAAVYSVVQKLCSILGCLKDLLSVERLTDSCILQLVKTSFSTFLVDNMQLLQLKSINLICGVFALYTQHRSFLIDETIQLLRKLQFSKRALRAYLLPDEEQKQIQMVTALLIQLVQFSGDLPEILKTSLTWNSILDSSIDASYPIKCNEAATKVCCLFWTSVLQRFTTAKAQDVSESKLILENLVIDLLTTLNLPEFPASAPILEVLCVLLLQNAGLTSKDISARCVAIDLLGMIAARLKRDAVACSSQSCWILNELLDEKSDGSNEAKDACSICLSARGVNIVCHVCQRCFHADCMGVSGQEILLQDWSCHVCLCKK